MTAQQKQHIEEVRKRIQKQFTGEGTGHDWWHMWRVWQTARRLALAEGANLYVVELAALLHDIADHKFHDGDRTVAPRLAREMLEEIGVDEDSIVQVCEIIPRVSFSGSGGKQNMESLEGKVVQDADRLDAIGAIATARVFQYSGYIQTLIYVPPEDNSPTAEEDRAASAIQHFYDKLLKLRDLMNTKTGRALAEERHQFMEQYLDTFYAEWNGEA